MTPLGRRIRELRAERGVSLAEMAEAIGVSSAYLSALEHGRRGRPTWLMTQRIIAYFNIIWDEAEELQMLAARSHPKVTIDTAGLDPAASELVHLLADEIARLSPASLATLSAAVRKAAKDDASAPARPAGAPSL